MKRPLFWAIAAFALGEVTYVMTGIMKIAGIVFTVSAFCVLIFMLNVRKANLPCNVEKRKQICLTAGAMSVMYLLGFLNMMLNEKEKSIEPCVGKNGSEVMIEGVLDDISMGEKNDCLYIKAYRTECAKHVHRDSYMFIVYGESLGLRVGDVLSVKGRLALIEKNNNPGAFDRQNYFEGRDVRYQLSPKDMIVTGYNKKYLVKSKMYSLKSYLSDSLSMLGFSAEAALYKGILLGDKSDISYEIKELYRRGGISHILAISSLHITLIGALLCGFLKRLGVHVYMANVISFCFIFFYGVMTRFSVAGVRAVIMMLISLVGNMTGRDYDLLTSLAVAYFITLFSEPAKLMDSASIMSFSAVIGIAAARYILRNLLRDRGIKLYSQKHKLKFSIISSLIFQACIQLVMLPVTVSFNYEIYTYSFFINLLVVPLMSVVVFSGFLGLVSFGLKLLFVGTSYFFVSKALFYPGIMLLRLYEVICRITLKLPFNVICIGHVSIYEVILYYLFLIMLFTLFSDRLRKKVVEKIYAAMGVLLDKRRWRRIFLMAVSILVAVAFICLSFLHGVINGEMIVFLDVGQGVGSIIRTENGCGLIFDCGSSSNGKTGVYTVLPAIKYMGLYKIDYWFISHADTDHVSGLLEILSDYELSGVGIENIVFGGDEVMSENGEKIKALAAEHGINIIYLMAGDEIKGNDFITRLVHPDKDFSQDDINEYSMAISYQSNHVRALFTGDMGQRALCCMLDNERELLCEKYDYIVIPHHGSKYSLNEELYNLVGEGVAIISCGKNNMYGHPHDEVLKALDEYGCEVHRTDEMGALVRRWKR